MTETFISNVYFVLVLDLSLPALLDCEIKIVGALRILETDTQGAARVLAQGGSEINPEGRGGRGAVGCVRCLHACREGEERLGSPPPPPPAQIEGF